MNATAPFQAIQPTSLPHGLDTTKPPRRSRAGGTAFTDEIIRKVTMFDTPYTSDDEYDFITNDEEPGEIFKFGRPLRESRFFPKKSIKKNLKVLNDFIDFSKEKNTSDWRFWGIAIPNNKSPVSDLKEEMKRFNKEINQHISDLRKRKLIEILMIGIHLRYDFSTNMFDLHAHMICRVTEEDYDFVRNKLFNEFSKTDISDDYIRNVAACATYILWGIIDHRDLVTWPADAFQEAWKLTTSKVRLMRTGGAFAKWRREERENRAQDTEAKVERARRAKNRTDTAYAAQKPPEVQVVAQLRIRLQRRSRRGVLVRRRHLPARKSGVVQPVLLPEGHPADASRKIPLRDTTYPSTTVVVTQESPGGGMEAALSVPASVNTSSCVTVPIARRRLPQQWWWKAWSYQGASPSAIWGSRGLPGPIRRRLAGCLDPSSEVTALGQRKTSRTWFRRAGRLTRG
ncbi:hypothetical protein G3T14_03070 [Methylobacterium sp. BTF04]|uniref:hypothetical protein n=1 Tax=Methylobacterium sp. BTF04 TaxID=2708300 RepID=UPI0013D0DE3E|nr:hypothetical protein [Methylobacterium sp. BTF04]NEU11111.1 hypothetical protein [Methylobacterium sp. BTF04]